jgi:hypothetical protein
LKKIQILIFLGSFLSSGKELYRAPEQKILLLDAVKAKFRNLLVRSSAIDCGDAVMELHFFQKLRNANKIVIADKYAHAYLWH